MNLKKRKYDWFLLGGILLAGCLIGVFTLFFSEKGDFVQVRVSGEVIANYSLFQNGTYDIQGNGGTNRLVIKNGEAWIEEASCPDGLCVKMGHIRKNGQSVICLPHQVVVEIIGKKGQNSTVDQVAG